MLMILCVISRDSRLVIIYSVISSSGILANSSKKEQFKQDGAPEKNYSMLAELLRNTRSIF